MYKINFSEQQYLKKGVFMTKKKIKKDINHESILKTANNQTEQQASRNGLNNIESNKSIKTCVG